MTHQILIDADACPVVRMAEATAKRYGVPVTLLCDESHALHSDYSTVRTVSKGADSVDLALINACRAGDLVITQDFGVAALAGLAAGVWSSLEELESLRRSQHVFEPRRDAAVCEAEYRRWLRAVERSRDWIENEV